MTLAEYEACAARTINGALTDTHLLLDAAAGLAEESGEILGVVRKHVFQARPLDRDELAKELGDALWCLAITARSAGISLDEIASVNVAKLRSRYPDGYNDTANRERTD